MVRKFVGLAGMFFVAALGATVGGWVTNNTDPVQFLSRKVLTPVVKPGDAVKIELDNYRVLRCPQKTTRIVTKSDGERYVTTDDKPAGFGVLGRDRYIASAPTPQDAVFGPATMYSYTERMCNPWEMVWPVVYGQWVDKFEFGPETQRIRPEDAPNTIVPKQGDVSR
jgi:hypothetical protein